MNRQPGTIQAIGNQRRQLTRRRMQRDVVRSVATARRPWLTALHGLCVLLMLVGVSLWPRSLVWAQEASEKNESDKPLYQQSPFDVLVVKRDGSRHKIVPLNLPKRTFVPQSSGFLKVRFVQDPSEEYAIRWSDVERIEFFEEMVLAEARRLTEAKKFDEAFRHLVLLLDHYPQTEGLEPAVQDYLYARAADDASAGRWNEALSGLEELYRRNPNYAGSGGRTVTSALSVVAGTVLENYVQRSEFANARRLLNRLSSAYGEERLPALGQARQKLVQLATQKVELARQHLKEEKFREAQQASLEAIAIWPKLEGAVELVREIARLYPVVRVGVSERAGRADASAIDDWPARRVGRLVSRTLVEFVKSGPEGGQYRSPLGTLERSDDYRQLSWQLRTPTADATQGPTAYQLSRVLVELATPGSPVYLPSWAEIVGSIQAEGMNRVQITLRRPYVLPEAVLRVPISSLAEESWSEAFRPYQLAQQTADEAVYVRTARRPGSMGSPPAEVYERFYQDTRDAVEDLRQGKILALDRVFPADAVRLLADDKQQQIVVRPYAQPVLHVLVPAAEHPYLNNAAFRRALLHGTPRAAILERLYGGKPLEGCRVLSAPLPAPRNASDATAYAYDPRWPEQPFDPGLAKLLVGVARQQLATLAEKNMQPAPELTPLIIVYPDDTVARFVCTIIAEQWRRLEIPCELRVFRSVEELSGQNYHLRYVTVMMEEPLLDCIRLLGPGGSGASNNPYVQLTLRRIQEATSWREVRQRMQELHQLLVADATVLPLFQTIECYAHNASLSGVGSQIVTLYQDIENWQIEPVIPQNE